MARTKRASNRRRSAANLITGLIVILVAFAFAPESVGAEQIKIGILKIAASGPVYLAQEKGYFTAEGLGVELVYFNASEPIAVATASGDIDLGVDGLTGGFYSLAGQGALRIIAGAYHEFPGFHNGGFLVSNRAFDGGLKTPKDLPGHSVAITQVGSTLHYVLGLIAEKYGFDLGSMRILPLQSAPNIVSAIVGGQADAAVVNGTAVMPLIQRGNAKLIGWVGDETPWQIGAIWCATKTADERRDTVERFLRAFRKGAQDYHEAFIDPDEKRNDGPTAPEVQTIIAKYMGQPVELVKLGIPYIDAEARLDVKDILHQIAWYKSQGMLKGPIDSEEIIDERYVVPLPER